MQFLVIRKADAETEAGAMPSPQLIDDMTSYNARLVERGVMKAGAGLRPSAKGARVSFSNGAPSVVDGPFAEAKELIAGFSVIEAGSLQEVIEMVKDWPSSDGHGNVQIEIRQIATAEDLGFNDAQQERYDRLVAQAAAQQQ
ncbi:MAG: YciI family protein [Devosia nanyangense]|uniref:YciI family protein n=1 Tax=Devosia nanyangense TaxID=1228055 RepID=A0A933L0D1_9HYPH|nr:YciI family protein [Devosia nanyangense]